MKVSFKIAPMPSINSDNNEDNSIDSNDRSLIYEHIPPASLHPFPGHRSISPRKDSLNSEYYYPMSEIKQATEQEIQNLSDLQRVVFQMRVELARLKTQTSANGTAMEILATRTRRVST